MNGITTSIDMFDHEKRTVFLHDDLLGRISSTDGRDFKAEPASKHPVKVITGETKAIEYLVRCSEKPAPPVPQVDRRQMAFF